MYLSTIEAMKLFGYKNHNSILHLVKTKEVTGIHFSSDWQKIFSQIRMP